MTKEAKVGLLLGLAFIIAIAVVLRGVQQEGPAISEELSVSGTRPTDETTEPIANRVQRVVGANQRHRSPSRVVSTRPLAPGPPPSSLIALTPPPVVHDSLPGSATSMSSPVVVRHRQELPAPVVVTPPSRSIERALDNLTESVNPEPLIRAVGSTSFATRPGRNRSRTPEQVYVVKPGDSISAVALHVYGEVEGNRLVNINRIYEANRDRMPNIDFLSVGQRLKIPKLPSQPRDRRQLPGSASERDTRSAKVYVVKEGDSLWKIAQTQLGEPSRHAEIAKLNRTTLPNADSLQPGMRLRLPDN